MSFDKKAKLWDSDPDKVERAKKLAIEIRNFLNNKTISKAFEFGSGTGLVSYFLKDDFKNITLADKSEGMLEVLNEKIEQENIHNFKPINIDLEKNSIDEQFEVIYTLLTLHHIKNLDLILSKFNQILVEDGYLIIADLEKEDGSFHSDSDNFDGHYGFDRQEIENILLKNGFHSIFYKTFHTIVKQRNGDKIKKYPVFILIAEK